MLYSILKILLKPSLFLVSRKIIVSHPAILKEEGPLLLACNHPNSFLDAVIIDLLFSQPVWSLARGDVFTTRFYKRLLGALKILPVYRTSEGAENLNENYNTFNECMDIFRNKGVILIFSEGMCINEWHLRKLKKGTARLAIKSWEEGIPVKVLPIGINYSSYRRFGKNIFLNIGNPVMSEEINLQAKDGIRHQAFNKKLNEELMRVVYEIPKENKQLQEEKLAIATPFITKIFLTIPAGIGYLLHFPLYFPLHRFTWRRTNHNDHFDSVLSALLIFTYPLYLLAISFGVYFISGNPWSFSLLFLLPLCAWCYVQVKPQMDF